MKRSLRLYSVLNWDSRGIEPLAGWEMVYDDQGQPVYAFHRSEHRYEKYGGTVFRRRRDAVAAAQKLRDQRVQELSEKLDVLARLQFN